MRTIYKYQLDISDDVSVSMKSGATILCVQMQGERACVWATVDSDADNATRRLNWRGTGHDLSGVLEHRYVGTVQYHGLVFHLFDRGEQ